MTHPKDKQAEGLRLTFQSEAASLIRPGDSILLHILVCALKPRGLSCSPVQLPASLPHGLQINLPHCPSLPRTPGVQCQHKAPNGHPLTGRMDPVRLTEFQSGALLPFSYVSLDKAILLILQTLPGQHGITGHDLEGSGGWMSYTHNTQTTSCHCGIALMN